MPTRQSYQLSPASWIYAVHDNRLSYISPLLWLRRGFEHLL